MLMIREECNKTTLKYKEYIVINNLESTTVEIKGKLNVDAYTDNTFIGTFNMKMIKLDLVLYF